MTLEISSTDIALGEGSAVGLEALRMSVMSAISIRGKNQVFGA
jgi:hypothetical protein